MNPRPRPEDLKRDINSFLWTQLPPDTTLCQAEDIASDLFHKINHEWECWQKRQDEAKQPIAVEG